MEVGLGAKTKSAEIKWNQKVLILVLMEVGLGAEWQ